jgi:hypothetical protein
MSEALEVTSDVLEVTLVTALEASSGGEPSVPSSSAVGDAVRRVLDLAAATRALADKHTSKELQTLARAKGLPGKGTKMVLAERLVQAC